jgi:hypothetical protein
MLRCAVIALSILATVSPNGAFSQTPTVGPGNMGNNAYTGTQNTKNYQGTAHKLLRSSAKISADIWQLHQ